MKIAVAGATGRVGRHVADLLKAGGHEVVAISRSSGVDVITREGLARALAGVEAVIDATSGPSTDQGAATEFKGGPMLTDAKTAAVEPNCSD